ncbi:hypothetical protein DPX39_090033100 [Trypanosoma brucei equiperdum]|uniref:Uncharacterized protein n=1 Tax=Trypanosoma brucei equiperdum TaxID=630700 RepID=A0A3L6L2A5_9TRYP|nr:hypothetical protein DPX39_090033100 [Trypanosoma brucei equiperdum]
MHKQGLTYKYGNEPRVFPERRKRERPPPSQPLDPQRDLAATAEIKSAAQTLMAVPPDCYGAQHSSVKRPAYEHRRESFRRSGHRRSQTETEQLSVEQRNFTSRQQNEGCSTQDVEDGAVKTTTHQPEVPPMEAKPPEPSPLQELLRRIIIFEFSSKCTQRSINVVRTICDTLCKNPAGVVEAMLVIEGCFADALKERNQQRLLHYWYIVDAIMKLFRDRQLMLEAVFVALPHLLLVYVPWNNSKLAMEPWFNREKDTENYKNLFNVWESIVPEKITNDIKKLWQDGFPVGIH